MVLTIFTFKNISYLKIVIEEQVNIQNNIFTAYFRLLNSASLVQNVKYSIFS